MVRAELSKPFNIGLDSKKSQFRDLSQLSSVGPVPGDIAEVEAYCRIFRAAERFHNALMQTLCNPLTGECTVSYTYPMEDMEDKIVSVLGCMVCLLNKGKEDVISGRSSVLNNFPVSDIRDERLPPLAAFRSEMKRYCESLHVALENYLTPDDSRSLNIWRKLQRLKSVCYDSGFPRGDGDPCHTLFANWNPVYLSLPKDEIETEDADVDFYMGSQVTEEGLEWLLQNGFKTIVDLRAETVKDVFYETVLNRAISSGKVELVELPVEVGTAPSLEQVEKFANILFNTFKESVYLHSREGVLRTSAMVSRWRQYVARYGANFVKGVVFNIEKRPSLEDINNSSDPPQDNLDHLDNDIKNGKNNGTYVEGVSHKDAITEQCDNGDALEISGLFRNINPLKSQLPPSNIFSRKEMSMFLKNKNISPPIFLDYQRRKYAKKVPPMEGYNAKLHSYTNGSTNNKNLAPKPPNSYTTSIVPSGPIMNESTGVASPVNFSNDSDKRVSSIPEKVDINRKVSKRSNDDELALIEGDMCASATGVVRVQSRKKAEMFLVRTDGFSCSREKVTESSLAFTHPSTQQQMLLWKTTPKTVLLLKKLGQELMEQAKEVASYLYHQEKMNVVVEPDVHDIFARIPGFGFVQTFYGQDTSELHERVDFIACLGGDGVILHASNLFRGSVPPVVSFNLGSLGFLTSHSFEDYRKDLKQVIHGNNTMDGVYITLRMRLRCEIFRKGKAMPGKIFDVLNEVVVDRGSNPYLSKVECYEHDRLITKVQGDGVIVATPTGSTAYSTAAGGSMVHPNVPCMLFTPICPHSLSFRPVILPDSAHLELKIPADARSNAWVSFDGKRRQQLSRGDSVRISMSQHPLPTVNKSDQTGDWFHSLIRCLNWNERLDQKAL